MSFVRFRLVMTLLAAFCTFFAYVCRLNLSLTIEDMIVKPLGDSDIYGDSFFFHNEEHTFSKVLNPVEKYKMLNKSAELTANLGNAHPREESATIISVGIDTQAPPVGDENSSSDQEVKRKPVLFDWSEGDKNDLLGAFFIGYVVSQIPGARMAEILGAKSIFLITGFGAALCSLVFPVAAKSSYTFAYIVRIILGISQGAMFPAVYVFLCEWLPGNERSSWLGVPSAFSRFGTIVMYFTLPTIMSYYDWEIAFYVCGFVTLIWCIAFIVFGSNSPQQSYWLSNEELVYIERHMEPKVETTLSKQVSTIETASGFTINEVVSNKENCSKGSLSQPSVSWWKIISNKALMLLSLVMFTSEWSNVLLLVKLPGYFRKVFSMSNDEIGWCSIGLIVIYCVQYPIASILATKLEIHTKLSSLNVRKIFEAAAHIMQGTGCLMIAFIENKIIVIIALSLMMLGRSTVGGGQCLMPPELSKEYPGTVFAYANTIANLAGVVGPKAINMMVSEPITLHGSWFWFWIFSGTLFFVAGAIFCLYADNAPQNYSRTPKPSNGDNSLSRNQLTFDKNPEEIFKMEAFARVASEPSPSRLQASSNARGERKSRESALI